MPRRLLPLTRLRPASVRGSGSSKVEASLTGRIHRCALVLSPSLHARMRRLKLSITACKYVRVPSSSLMTVTSMCRDSFGLVARMPSLGLAGYTRWRCPLSPQGERTQAHVAVVLGDNHVPHVRKLVGGELGWRCMGASRTIVERADLLAPVPIVIPGSGQPRHSEGDGKWDSLRGVRDGFQEGALGGAVGQVVRVETESGEGDEEEGQADAGQEEPDPAFESEDLGLKLELVQGQDMGGDDRALAAANPARGGRARDAELMEKRGVTFFTDDVPKSVVIRLTAGRGWHASRLSALGSPRKAAEG